VNKTALKTVD